MDTPEFKEVLKATKENPVRWECFYQALYADGRKWKWLYEVNEHHAVDESFDNKDMVWLETTADPKVFVVYTKDDWRLGWVCNERGICEESLDRLCFPINTVGGVLQSDGIFYRTVRLE